VRKLSLAVGTMAAVLGALSFSTASLGLADGLFGISGLHGGFPTPAAQPHGPPGWSVVRDLSIGTCFAVQDHGGYLGGTQVGHYQSQPEAEAGLRFMRGNGVCR
jgi:hypothetical protein